MCVDEDNQNNYVCVVLYTLQTLSVALIYLHLPLMGILWGFFF